MPLKDFTFIALFSKGLDFLTHIDYYLYFLCFLTLLIYYAFYLTPLAVKGQARSLASDAEEPLSLIIAYKDELSNLRSNLDNWLNQDYSDYELILVNDHSSDGSKEFLEKQMDPRIKLLDLRSGKGKKAAIQLGIEQANYELLVFTDADCKARSKRWLMEFSRTFQEGKELVIGFSGFYKKASLLNLLQRYENAMNSLQNFSMILKGRAYMGVGRNLAYRKQLFKEAKHHRAEVLSGDDDLLVNQLSKSGNTGFCERVEAQTISKAESNWSSYFHQKRRQLEAGKYYKMADRLRLAILGGSQLLFNLLFIKHLVLAEHLPIILAIFVSKIILQLMVYALPMKRLGEMDLWWLTPLLEIIYLPLISLIGISQYLYKVDRWK